jgi:hypothetical protein
VEGRALAEAYVKSYSAPFDWDLMRSLLHPDHVEEWPQSGERIRGLDNKRAILENYPGGIPEAGVGTRRIVGSDGKVQAITGPGPKFFVVRVSGSGDSYTFEGTARYQTGEIAHVVSIIEIRDGLVWRQTSYFAPPFQAPEWRAQWTEPMG